MGIEIFCDSCYNTISDVDIKYEGATALVALDVCIKGEHYFLCQDCREGGLIRTSNGPLLYGTVAQKFLERERLVDEKHKEKMQALREKHSMTSAELKAEEEALPKHHIIAIGGNPNSPVSPVKALLMAEREAKKAVEAGESSVSLAEFKALEDALNELTQTVSQLRASDTVHHMVFGENNPFITPKTLEECGVTGSLGCNNPTTENDLALSVCKHEDIELIDYYEGEELRVGTHGPRKMVDSNVYCANCGDRANYLNDRDKYFDMVDNGFVLKRTEVLSRKMNENYKEE